MLKVIKDGAFSITENMAKDNYLFEQAANNKIILIRFYTWQKSGFSYGYLQDENNVQEIIKKNYPLKQGLEMIKRPTGGSIVLHNPLEIAYCFVANKQLMPLNLMQSYFLISEQIKIALIELGYNVKNQKKLNNGLKKNRPDLCFAKAELYELVNQYGQKVVGSAQRRTKKAIIQQGSIKIDLL